MYTIIYVFYDTQKIHLRIEYWMYIDSIVDLFFTNFEFKWFIAIKCIRYILLY